jgi:hypothetical protein
MGLQVRQLACLFGREEREDRRRAAVERVV